MAILSHLLFQVFILIGLAVGGFLAFQNSDLVTFKLGQLSFIDTPLWLVVFSAFFIGVFVGFMINFNNSLSKKFKK